MIWHKQTIIRAITVGAFILAPVLIGLISLDWVESGPTLCLHKRFTGLDCLGCGMTRAIVALLHGQFTEAIAYNKGVVLAGPALGFFWLKGFLWHARELHREITESH